MKQDLLEQLGDLARGQQAPPCGDERFEALTRGELDNAEQEQLQRDSQTSACRRAVYEASVPFDEGARDRFFQAAKQGLGEGTGSAPHEPEAAPGEDGPDEEKPAAEVIPLHRRPVVRGLTGGGLLLAAAALAILLVRPTPHPALPTYELRMSGGEQAMRSADAAAAGVPVIGPESMMRLVLRPSVPSSDGVAARAFLVDEDGFADGKARRAQSVTPLDLPARVSPEGAVRIDVPGDVVVHHTSNDRAWLVVAIGYEHAMPVTGSELVAASTGDQEACRVVARSIRVREP